MKKSKIQTVVPHIVKSSDSRSLADRVNEFHVQVIERRLNKSGLTVKQKIAVIDLIIEKLKSRETAGVIE